MPTRTAFRYSLIGWVLVLAILILYSQMIVQIDNRVEALRLDVSIIKENRTASKEQILLMESNKARIDRLEKKTP